MQNYWNKEEKRGGEGQGKDRAGDRMKGRVVERRGEEHFSEHAKGPRDYCGPHVFLPLFSPALPQPLIFIG